MTESSPSIIVNQKGTKNLPMVMKALHIRENVFTEQEAINMGLKVDKSINYHGLGKELFLKIIDGLNDVTLAYRGTKNADNPERRENYFLLISQYKDSQGNTVNVPVFIYEKGQYNRVLIDTNKIATVFGRNDFNNYINREIQKGNLVRIKNRGIQVSERAAPIADGYNEKTSTVDRVPQKESKVNTFDKNNSENPSTKFSNENMNDGKADNQSNNNNDVKYSTKNADELIENAEKASADTGKITKDMPDEERSKIISQKRITVPTYNKDKFDVIKDFDINILKETYKGKAHSIIKNIDKNFNITNKMYSNKDIELDFEYSKSSLKESVNKQNKNYDDFAKMLSVFDDVVTNAVGIEVHDDKYKGTLREDTALQNMYVLASAFKDGDIIVPVQLEIKNYSDRANKLYLTVTLDKNQRNSESATSLGQNQLHNGITVPSDISISDLVKAVNASNRKFFDVV